MANSDVAMIEGAVIRAEAMALMKSIYFRAPDGNLIERADDTQGQDRWRSCA